MAFLLESRAATQAASRTWPPLVVVAGLLAIGVAYEDGTFGAAGALLDRLPGGETALFLSREPGPCEWWISPRMSRCYGSGCRYPNRPFASSFGPAVKYRR